MKPWFVYAFLGGMFAVWFVGLIAPENWVWWQTSGATAVLIAAVVLFSASFKAQP